MSCSGEQEGALIAAALWLVSCEVHLLRRGYGVNERFAPMIKKVLKQLHYEKTLIRQICVPRPEDTLAERKLLANIMVEACCEADVKIFDDTIIDTIYQEARSSPIALMALLTVLEDENLGVIAIAP